MKAVPFVSLLSLTLTILILSNNKIMSQDTTKDKTAGKMQKMLDAKKFVFIAQSVTPQRGAFRQLTTTYDLKVTNDSVICDLPYFGRAYSAPIDPSSGGINFTSTSFEYVVKPHKKNGWDVLIKPTDERDAPQLLLSVFTNGTASLQVTSNNRQPISFNGYVKERE